MLEKRAVSAPAEPKLFDHPLRAALYARVSTHDQQTLTLQVEAMRKYAGLRRRGAPMRG